MERVGGQMDRDELLIKCDYKFLFIYNLRMQWENCRFFKRNMKMSKRRTEYGQVHGQI